MDAKRGPRRALRTLTGCFKCRQRRKKCDERKPVCSGCAKQDFKCVWPAPKKATGNNRSAEGSSSQTGMQLELKKVSHSPFSDSSTKFTNASAASYGLPGITTQMDHYLSLYLREGFLPKVLRSNAHPGFQDWRHLITVGSESTTTMYSFLATAAMHASWTTPKLKVAALRYYSLVIKGLRTAIVDGTVTGSEDWVLQATNFLLLFEINQGWNARHNPSGAVPHLEALTKILKIRIAKDAERPHDFVHPQNRISAESLVFWASTLSLYYSDVDRIGNEIDWQDFSTYLVPDVFPGASSQANSPLLASNWELHKTIIQVVRLSHALPLNDNSWAYGEVMELELKQREGEVREDFGSASNPEKSITDVLQQTLLYILASRIVIFKTLRPEARTCDPEIRKLVTDAMEIVRALEIEPRCGPLLCWPMAVVSCAIERETDASLLRDKLERVWLASYCGKVDRARTAVEVFWEKMGEGCNLLDFLVYPGGMFKHPYLKESL